MANSVAYVCVDQAALSLGLAIVPLHLTDNPGNLAYILGDSGASALIIDNPAYWARLAPEVRDLAEPEARGGRRRTATTRTHRGGPSRRARFAMAGRGRGARGA